MRTSTFKSLAAALVCCVFGALGCSPRGADGVGGVGLALQVAPGISLGAVSYSITGPGGFARSGAFDTSHSTTPSATIGGLPAGDGFSVALSATASDGATQCAGSAPFSVVAHATTGVTVHLLCHEPSKAGSVLVNGSLNVCPVVDGVSATPDEVLVGSSIALAGAAHDADGAPAPLTYHWTASAGTLSDASAASPTFTCTTGGAATITLAVSDGDCGDSQSVTVTCTGAARIVINEIESNGDPVGDWVELANAGAASADISGWKLKDNDDTHDFVVVPTGTMLAPGGFVRIYVFQTFGLGAPDMARLFDPAGNLVDSYSWTTHATGTYGRCPDGTGPFVDSTPTPGASNACGGATGAAGSGGAAGAGAAGTSGAAGAGAAGTSGTAGSGAAGAGDAPIVINEVESNGDPVGDWVELTNTGASTADISGWKLKDNDDTHAFVVVPSGTSLAPGGFFRIYVFQTFGLGAPDMARLFDPAGNLVDSYSWTTHATGTYGRCPDGTGAFVDSTPTPAAPNACGGGAGSGGVGAAGAGGSGGTGGLAGNEFPWPSTDPVITVDDSGEFASNLSGLSYQPATSSEPDVLWGIQNGPSKLYRLLLNPVTQTWESDTANDWGAGKTIHYLDGTGDPDSEGVSKAELADAAIYVSTERDNDNNQVNRFSVLRYDTTAAGTDLTATNDWELTPDLPAMGINLGLEAITYIPDTALVAGGFFDEAASVPYDPSRYPNHGTGLFFVGLESNGVIYAYALDHADNSFTRVATFPSGQVSIMDLSYDRDVGYLWAQCDNTCGNKATVFRIDTAPLSPTLGRFQIGRVFDRPETLPDSNFEGIGIAPESECAGGLKHFFWSDDSALDMHSIRRGSIPCGAFF
jgi:Lamin Tail Domain